MRLCTFAVLTFSRLNLLIFTVHKTCRNYNTHKILNIDIFINATMLYTFWNYMTVY